MAQDTSQDVIDTMHKISAINDPLVERISMKIGLGYEQLLVCAQR